MGCSENSVPNKRGADSDVHEEREYYEDEINLIDYFLVLGRHNRLIILGSILPALLVGLGCFFWPRDYKISFTYNVGLGEKAFRVLEERFYSTENLGRIFEKLEENGFAAYAGKLKKIRTTYGLKKFVSFEAGPERFDKMQEKQQQRETLLVMSVKAKSEKTILGIASVFRENFEQVIPLYSVKEALDDKIINLKEKMAAIEEARYALNQQLDSKKSILKKFKSSGSEGIERLPGGIVIHFDNVIDSSEYLPLPYQIQAAKTHIINLEEQIRTNQENYSYYAKLLGLNHKISNYLKQNGNIEQYHSFLVRKLEDYKETQQVKDYLSAYTKRFENKMSDKTPIIEEPKVFPIARGTVKKAVITFAVAFLISVFGAFLLEGLQKNQART